MRTALLTIGLVSLHACVDAEDATSTDQQLQRGDLAPQARREETIEVNDCRPGFLLFGDDDNMTCIPDPGGGGGGGGGWSPPGERGPG
jgi:hypothetical protein